MKFVNSIVSVNRCGGSCYTVDEKVNVKVFNLMSRVNEKKDFKFNMNHVSVNVD